MRHNVTHGMCLMQVGYSHLGGKYAQRNESK